jgi:endonuclease/exonuclease/phosphatase family metal-dependent hydrolase
MKKSLFILLVVGILFQVQGQDIDVISYNIRYDNPKDYPNNWDNRKEFLMTQLQFYAPDVFGIQEGLLHQLKDMDQGMPEYTYFGVGRDDGVEKGEFSAIFYKTEALQLLDQSTFWLSTTPNVPSKGWDAALPRICTYGLFQRKADGAKFLVFNTHFDHVGEKAREESAKLIIEKIKALNPENLPVILTGDFNLESDSPGVQVILQYMDDTFVGAESAAFGPSGTFNGFEFNKPVERRIDYIFVSPGNVQIRKSAILSDSKDCRYPSDHLPVFARLHLK